MQPSHWLLTCATWGRRFRLPAAVRRPSSQLSFPGEQRPRAVPTVAAFLVAAAVIACIVGTSLLFPGRLLLWLSQFNRPGMAAFRLLGRMSGVLLLGLGAACAVAAAGLLRRRKWAWRFAIALFAVNASGDLVSLFLTREWWRSAAGVAVSSTFLYSLTRRSVRSYFNHPARG